jgi:hypothetical protein
MPRCLAVTAALLIAACGARPTATPSSTPAPAGTRWFATWGAAEVAAPARPPRDSIDRTPTLVGQTIRLIVRTSIGGDRARIHLSNEYGDRPLVIGSAHIAVYDTGAAIVVDGLRATFGGNAGITLRPGAVAMSVQSLDVPKPADVSVSIYFADSARLATRHPLALRTSHVGRGNVTGSRAFAPDTSINVAIPDPTTSLTPPTGVIVTPNSITDGTASTRNANRRWSMLAQLS